MIHLEKRERLYGEFPLLQWEKSNEGEPPSNNIVFHDPDRFASQILPEFAFPRTTFNSLVRKMYRWGFRRAVGDDQSPDPRVKAYSCEKFRRGHLALVKQMCCSYSRTKNSRTQSTQHTAMNTFVKTSTAVPSYPSLEIRQTQEKRCKRQKTSEQDCPRLENPFAESCESVGCPVQLPDPQTSINRLSGFDRNGCIPFVRPDGLLPATIPSQSMQLQLHSIMSRQCLEERVLRATLQQLRAEAVPNRNCVNLAPNSTLTLSHSMPCEVKSRILYPPAMTHPNRTMAPNLYQTLRTGLGNVNANFPGWAPEPSRSSMLTVFEFVYDSGS
jgi:HSF-type DNA-binding